MTSLEEVGRRTEQPDPVGARADPVELGELSVVVHESRGVEETVEAVVDFAVKAVGATVAAIALWSRRQGLRPVAATVPELDALLGVGPPDEDGPILQVLQTVDAVAVDDAEADVRWPAWCAQAAELGLRSILLLRLSVGERAAGIVLAAHTEPHAFDRDDLAVAHIVARHASIAVATAQHAANLAEAVDARKLVGQAMGILMERFGIDADHAFEVLRRYSQVGNLKLRDVACHLIETRQLPPLRS